MAKAASILFLQPARLLKINRGLSSGNGLVAWIFVCITALPFFVVSLFNRPQGYDYWITALVRERGYVPAQAMLYDTVTARYLLLAIIFR